MMFENFLRKLFNIFQRPRRPGQPPAPHRPPAPTTTPPAQMPRNDEMLLRWAREEMAKVTSREPTSSELAMGVAHFKAEPYASQSETDVRRAMYDAAKKEAESNDWPPPSSQTPF